MTWGQAKISLKGHKNHYKDNKVGFIKIKTPLNFKKMYKQIIDEKKYLQTLNRGYTYIFMCIGACMYVCILRKQIHMHIHPGYIKNFHNSIVKGICNTVFLRFEDKGVWFQMVEQKDVHSSPPVRAPELQLLTGRLWNPPKKRLPTPKDKGEATVRRQERHSHDKIKSHTCWVGNPQTGEQ